MNATVTVSIRIPAADARLIKKAAKARGLKMGPWIREAAILAAEQNPELRRLFSTTTPDVKVVYR